MIIAPLIRQMNVWYSSKKMEILVTFCLSGKTVETLALIDSGAAGVFMDERFTQQYGFTWQKLPKDIEVFNVDGTLNQNGSITEKVETSLEISGQKMFERFLVTALEMQQI